MMNSTQHNDANGGTPLAEPTGSTEILRQARHYLNETLGYLEKYKEWNESGKQYAVDCAVRSCDEAWKRVNFVLSNAGGKRDDD